VVPRVKLEGAKIMESRAKLVGHAIHPILIVFPLGLLATGIVFDLIYLIQGNQVMELVAFWLIVAGIIGGLLAAPFGWIDWFAIPRSTRAWSVGLVHGLGNTVVLLLFAASLWLRWDVPTAPPLAAHILSFAGGGLAVITGWLGGELVGRLGMAVDDNANLNAPNSLTTATVPPPR
jgi:uncharacterized membrane protein